MSLSVSCVADESGKAALREREIGLRIDKTRVHATVKDIWRRVLGRKAVAGKDLLHLEIGVRRILRMLSLIEAETGVWISPTAALKLGTAEAIADAIVDGSFPAPSPLILLKPGDRSPALFIVAGGGGFILDQVHLADAIDYRGPIYGLQLKGLEGIEAPLDRVEDIAGYYLQHIHGFQPTGPYHVLGYSFGGLIAAEMGRGLSQSGREVGFIGVLDGYLHEACWPASAWCAFMFDRFLKKLGKSQNLPIKQSAAIVWGGFKSFVRRLKGRSRPAHRFDARRSPHYIGGLPPQVQSVRDGAIAAYEAYRPQAVACRVTLLKSTKGDVHFCDPAKVWGRLISDLEIVIVPGSHATMVRLPFASDLAREISERLRRYDREPD